MKEMHIRMNNMREFMKFKVFLVIINMIQRQYKIQNLSYHYIIFDTNYHISSFEFNKFLSQVIFKFQHEIK